MYGWAAVLGCVVFAGLAWRQFSAAELMPAAARNFLASLTPTQREKVVFPFAADERYNWHYIPRARRGLPLAEMTPAQKHLAHALLAARLSHSGYMKAENVMSLEDVLRELEHGTGPVRDPELYYFSIFGTGAPAGVWGYRVEGHHLSLNFTVAGGRVSATPDFFGANPAKVRDGPRKGFRALAAEEDVGRQLVESLDPAQRAEAVVNAAAYPDILTGASRKAALAGQANGLPAAKMDPKQRAILTALVEVYASDFPEPLASARLEQAKRAGNDLWFAWAGSITPGEPHYYRIQCPEFLVEFDNTQNHANHIHSVWRDFHGDWGEDLLAAHYNASHSK